MLEKMWGQVALATSSMRLVLWQPNFESAVLTPKQKLYNLSLETLPCNSMSSSQKRNLQLENGVALVFIITTVC